MSCTVKPSDPRTRDRQTRWASTSRGPRHLQRGAPRIPRRPITPRFSMMPFPRTSRPAERGESALTGSPPNPTKCAGPEDVGKLHHDEELYVWYECVFDRRRSVFTWAIVPPAD